jgi:hypothetical protein
MYKFEKLDHCQPAETMTYIDSRALGKAQPEPWTLEWEITRLMGAPSLDQAIFRLGVLPAGESLVALQHVKSWTRGGAETYVLPFEIMCESGRSIELMLKAVVAFSPARSLDNILSSWVSRRTLLRSVGVSLPTLYFFGHGVLIEDFIEFDLRSKLRSGTANQQELVDQVFQYAGSLVRLKFAPVDAFADLRTNGSTVFAIDLGEDLGEPNLAGCNEADVFEQALRWVNMSIEHPAALDVLRLREIFCFNITQNMRVN